LRQAYLDSPTLFASGFDLYGTITLDAPANSANYGDNLNSFIEFNLAGVPEPSTWSLFAVGLGGLAFLRQRKNP
jgi:PEP-CTERM motif